MGRKLSQHFFGGGNIPSDLPVSVNGFTVQLKLNAEDT